MSNTWTSLDEKELQLLQQNPYAYADCCSDDECDDREQQRSLNGSQIKYLLKKKAAALAKLKKENAKKDKLEREKAEAAIVHKEVVYNTSKKVDTWLKLNENLF